MGMEAETRRFYRDASNKVKSAEIRKLLGELADAEEDHQDVLVEKWKEKKKSGVFPKKKVRDNREVFLHTNLWNKSNDADG